eukprot:gene17723-21114_t
MRRSSIDTIAIDGGDSSPAVANDSIGTEEEHWRRISKEKRKTMDRKKAYDGAPRKSTGGMGEFHRYHLEYNLLESPPPLLFNLGYQALEFPPASLFNL